MKAVSLKDQVVASVSGHIIEFKKGVVIDVPDDEILIAALTAAGIQDADTVDEDVIAVARGEKVAVDAKKAK